MHFYFLLILYRSDGFRKSLKSCQKLTFTLACAVGFYLQKRCIGIALYAHIFKAVIITEFHCVIYNSDCSVGKSFSLFIIEHSHTRCLVEQFFRIITYEFIYISIFFIRLRQISVACTGIIMYGKSEFFINSIIKELTAMGTHKAYIFFIFRFCFFLKSIHSQIGVKFISAVSRISIRKLFECF